MQYCDQKFNENESRTMETAEAKKMSLTDEADAEDDFKLVAETEFRKIEGKAKNVGYADGVAAGREGSFQTGFDYGWMNGLHAALTMEKYRAFYENLDTEKVENKDLLSEQQKFKEATEPEIKEPQFDPKEQSLAEMAENHKKHVNQILSDYKSNYPLATALLIKKEDT